MSNREVQTTSAPSAMTRLEVWVLAILLIFGSLIRVTRFWQERSLWLDEGSLAFNIIDRDYLGLTRPLSYEQGAPIGFLWFTKLAVQIFGVNEGVMYHNVAGPRYRNFLLF